MKPKFAQASLFDHEPAPDVCRPRHRGNRESRDANEAVQPSKKALQQKIWDFIKRRGPHGATCDEAEVALGLSHQTCSARFTELAQAGRIRKLADRRATRSGSKAAVWVVV